MADNNTIDIFGKLKAVTEEGILVDKSQVGGMEELENKIPAAASKQNQLADKEYVRTLMDENGNFYKFYPGPDKDPTQDTRIWFPTSNRGVQRNVRGVQGEFFLGTRDISVAIRDEYGRLFVSDPTEDGHATTKRYVDGVIKDAVEGNIPTDMYLPVAGGEMKGPIHWNANSLPQNTDPLYFLTISGFGNAGDSGTTKWADLPTAKKVLGVPNADDFLSRSGGKMDGTVTWESGALPQKTTTGVDAIAVFIKGFDGARTLAYVDRANFQRYYLRYYACWLANRSTVATGDIDFYTPANGTDFFFVMARIRETNIWQHSLIPMSIITDMKKTDASNSFSLLDDSSGARLEGYFSNIGNNQYRLHISNNWVSVGNPYSDLTIYAL